MRLNSILMGLMLMDRLRRYKNKSMDLAKINMSIAYVRVVKQLRLLFLKMMAGGLWVLLLMNGLNLFYITFLMFAPVTDTAKFYVMTGITIAYLLVATITFIYFFSEQKWMEMFNVDELLESVKTTSLGREKQNKEVRS